jgi:uncharacterized membrane protein
MPKYLNTLIVYIYQISLTNVISLQKLNEEEQKIKTVLKNSNSLMYIEKISKETGISRATVSKYLIKFEALGEIKIEKFATAKIVRWVGK